MVTAVSIRPATPPPDDRRCTAKSKRSGERCRLWAMRGGRVCRIHGGKAPQVVSAAKQRRLVAKAEADASAALASIGVDVAGFDPVESLTRVAAEIEALKDALAKRVNALSEMRYQAGSGEQVRAELAAYERGLDRTVKACESLAKLNLEERRQNAAERYAVEVVQLLGLIFDDLVLSEQQMERLPMVVSHHLGQVVKGELAP